MTVQRYFRQAQLTLLTEKRAAFCHLDLVQVPLSAMLVVACVQASLVRQVNRLAGMQPGGVRRERSLSQVLRFNLVLLNIFSGNIFPPGAGGLLLHHHPIPALTRVPPSTLPRDSAGDQQIPMRFY